LSALPNSAAAIDLLKWVIANPNKPFDPNMVVSATHTSDWQWQAVLAQMEDLGRQGYITKLKQDGGGSTYWTITGKGENYLRALERAENANGELEPAKAAPSDLATSGPGATTQPPSAEVALQMLTKAFGADSIPLNGTTSLTFTISNPESRAMTGVGLSDDLPAGLVVSTPNGLTGSYGGGSVTAAAGSNSILLSGASVAPGASCNFTVNVTGIEVGKKNNIARAVAFIEDSIMNSPVASASVVVLAASAPGVFPVTRESAEWLDKSTIERFTDETWTILDSANRIREERKGPAVSAFDLVMAFGRQPGGQLSDLLEQAGVNLNSLIPETTDAAAEAPPEDVASGTRRKLPPITPYVRMALVRARDKANATRSATIDDSHLLFGLLSLGDTDNLLIQGFNRQGIMPDKIKLPVEVAPGTETARPQAGYKSDDPTGEDLLDISKEVNALASVLAGKDVEPPLSLGLFGDWGTGKSFFMRQLEGRIRELTEDAKQADGKSQYCQDVVQLTFNAWNYIDKDLWASLASEIFEGLAAALTQKRGVDSQAGRALAMAAASSSPTVVAETERQKSKAEAQLRESEAQLAELQRNQKNIEPRLSAREVLNQAARFAVKDDNLQKQAQQVAQEIGVTKGVAAVGEIQTQLLELSNIWTEIAFSLRNNRLWVWGLASVFGLGVGWGALYLAKRYVTGDIANAVVTILAAGSTVVTVLLTGSRKILRFVRAIKASKQELIDKTQQAVKQKIDHVRESVEKAAETVKVLNQQLADMRADRQMVDFIRQRYDSSDYRENLGTIARVRSDFRHLSVLLRDVQKESERDLEEIKERQQEKDKERKTPLFPRIARIILYVDDLDRCPEKNVVEVLQAVHLLLAFPLFVVVVGVDPRWLLHSLQQHSGAFESEGANADGEPQEETRWESTPMNYLEKIFQIPFTLRPIDESGFSKLVDAFAASGRETDSVELGALPQQSQISVSSQPAASPVVPSAVIVSPETQPASSTAAPSLPEIPAPPPSSQKKQVQLEHLGVAAAREPIDRHPAHLRIEEWERNFMKTLHDLIPSPRAGKRFINIYRLLRASVRVGEQGQFVGDHEDGEYQCALLLLAILTGYPAEATQILRTLVEEEHTESWGEMLRALKSRLGATSEEKARDVQRVSNARTGRLDVKSAEPVGIAGFPTLQAQHWVELFDKLAKVEHNLDDRSCQGFAKWAPRVARYSFQSGRVLLQRRSAKPKPLPDSLAM
jgi:hypothetical protein